MIPRMSNANAWSSNLDFQHESSNYDSLYEHAESHINKSAVNLIPHTEENHLPSLESKFNMYIITNDECVFIKIVLLCNSL